MRTTLQGKLERGLNVDPNLRYNPNSITHTNLGRDHAPSL
jgi:hypothetical protein